MPVFELLALLLVAGGVWLWIDSLKAREAAVRAAQAACQADGLQLLDETVAIRALRLARDEEGRLRLVREYDFEFSDFEFTASGDDRRDGRVTLMGYDIEMLHLRQRPRVIRISYGADEDGGKNLPPPLN